jgi:hypothetical protein
MKPDDAIRLRHITLWKSATEEIPELLTQLKPLLPGA